MLLLIALVAGALALSLIVPPLCRELIRTRLHGYRVELNRPDASLPLTLPTTHTKSVAIIGGGIAGLTAAITLARRGFRVELFEANAHLGGKLGSWKQQLTPTEEAFVSHGFHAFFPNYFNLNRFLDSMGLRAHFQSIGEYVIWGRSGEAIRFGKLETTPIFNLFALAKAGVYHLRDVLKAPARDLFGVFLEYDETETFERYDHVSFADFDRLAQLPPKLKLAFNTFSRAFFADEDKLSLAELIKSFHFYYLSQDGGLVYDFPTRDYEPGLLAPMRAELEKHGARVWLSSPVTELVKTERRFLVNQRPFDGVVLATDVVGTKAVMGQAQGIAERVRAPFEQLRPGQPYAVLRLWVDRDVRTGIPPFVITDRLRVLDAFTTYHRFEREARAWTQNHGGAVLELHCYAVPADLTKDALRQLLIDEMFTFFPELKGCSIKHEAFQVQQNFTAFHVGMYATRPTVDSGVEGLVCAGDWVKLPFPAMLLEAACASGLMAANVLLRQAHLQEEPISSVPPRGLMAGLPQPLARQMLSNRRTSTVSSGTP